MNKWAKYILFNSSALFLLNQLDVFEKFDKLLDCLHANFGINLITKDFNSNIVFPKFSIRLFLKFTIILQSG